MQYLHVTPKPPKPDEKSNKPPPKTHTFSAAFLASIEADHMWPGGASETDNKRPILLVVAAKKTALTPFLMNIKSMGRPADANESPSPSTSSSRYNKGDRIELLKTGGYAIAQQPLEDGNIITTIYMRPLLALDAGMIDAVQCSFVAAPPLWWIQEQERNLTAQQRQRILSWAGAYGTLQGTEQRFAPMQLEADQLFHHAAIAAYIVAYLDRRTKNPIMSDVGFYMHLYFTGLKEGIFSLPQTKESLQAHSLYRYDSSQSVKDDAWLWARSRGHAEFRADRITNVGYVTAIACHVTHADLDVFLAQCVQSYLANYTGDEK